MGPAAQVLATLNPRLKKIYTYIVCIGSSGIYQLVMRRKLLCYIQGGPKKTERHTSGNLGI